MRDPRKILLPFSGIYPLKTLIKKTGKSLIFPFYHAVSDRPAAHLKHLYRIKSKNEFIKDIDQLLKNFEAVSPEILLDREGPAQLTKPSFILSFDDGLREVKETILPILKQKGVPAIFFLNNNFIGNKALFYRYKISLLLDYFIKNPLNSGELKILSDLLKSRVANFNEIEKCLLQLAYRDIELIDQLSNTFKIDFKTYLSERQPYLNEDEVFEIKDQGFFIGSHSFDHPEFSDLSQANQLMEITESSADIKKRFGLDYSFFAFPFSDIGVSKASLEEIHQAEDGPDVTFGTSGMKPSLKFPHYQRIAMEKTSTDALRIIKTEYFYFSLKSVLKLNS